jgi:hypothetical protein
MEYGIVYLWYDIKHQRFYLGSHWGTENVIIYTVFGRSKNR